MATQAALTAEEAAVYDRQLRVWGIDAQTRMRGSRVLLVGLSGLAAEIAKNLALAGIGAITVADADTVAVTDLSANFFLADGDIGANRAIAAAPRLQTLNTMCKIIADRRPLAQFRDTELQQYNAIILTAPSTEGVLRVDAVCRSQSPPIALIACWLYGDVGLSLTDLTEHSYSYSKKEGTDAQPVTLTGTQSYPPLSHVLSLTEAQLASLVGKRKSDKLLMQLLLSLLNHIKRTVTNERFALFESLSVSSHCAIFGGIIAQDTLKIVSGKEEPHQNAIVYNAQSDFQATVKFLK